jgi:predicted transcriptional regulator
MNFHTGKCEHCGGSGFQMDHVKAGQHFRARRERLKISLREIAGYLGLSAPYVSDLERGRRNWTGERIEQYEKYLAKRQKTLA